MTPSITPFGLYIHVPFCHARCGYCDFVTFTGKEARIDGYVENLVKEMELFVRSEPAVGPSVSTIFFGGGTPSILEREHLETLFAALKTNFSPLTTLETTLEANPESVTAEKAAAWRSVGINRISLGLQAMDDALLKAMGRLHDVAQFMRAYNDLRKAGFDNLNIDLIYGFPGQSLEAWKQTVTRSADLAPEHLALYSLLVEEHTPFAVAGVTTDNDLQAQMYEWARHYLRGKGYPQYEVSNFARPDRECRHNLLYWRAQDYAGLGVGAVGSIQGVRWQNYKTLDLYERAIRDARLPRASVEQLDPATRRFERLMLGLRLREGMPWSDDLAPTWRVQRDRLASEGLLEEFQPGRWRIPDAHIALTNQVLLPFL